jgi:ComF family protein
VCQGPYAGELREAVLRIKRSSEQALALTMGRLFSGRCVEALGAFMPDVIVPVPMHWSRRLSRGTNNPDLVAECLGARMSVRVDRIGLRRRRYTRPQAGLSPRQRLLNVRGAFRVRLGHTFLEARVLLVDDIVTTGATSSAAAGALKKAGAAAVVVAAIARADGPI